MIGSIILGLAQLVPSILPLLTKDETAQKAAQVVSDVAKAVTGADTDEGALEALRGDPAKVLEYQSAMNAHAATMYAEETKRLESVNATMRAEAASCDPYVRRWRPTWGYCTCLVWGAQGLAYAYTVAFEPQYAAEVGQGIAALTGIWSVALAVLGVAVWTRSQDKKGPQQSGIARVIASMAGKQ